MLQNRKQRKAEIRASMTLLFREALFTLLFTQDSSIDGESGVIRRSMISPSSLEPTDPGCLRRDRGFEKDRDRERGSIPELPCFPKNFSTRRVGHQQLRMRHQIPSGFPLLDGLSFPLGLAQISRFEVLLMKTRCESRTSPSSAEAEISCHMSCEFCF